MAISTRELIHQSLRLINVLGSGETASNDDIEVCKTALYQLIDSWSNSPLLQYTVNFFEFPLTGRQTYTIGTGGDFNTPRPMTIKQAYARLNPGTPQQLDIKMKILTDEEYGDISVKNTPSTFPYALYQNGNYPLRTIYLFPIPTGPCSLVLWMYQPLVNLNNIDEVVTYPQGYERLFTYRLALEIAPLFGKQPSEYVQVTAENSKNELEAMNFTPEYRHGDGGMIVRGRGGKIPSAILTGGFFK